MLAGHPGAEAFLAQHLSNPGHRGDLALDRLAPPTLAYTALVEALEKYRGMVRTGGFPTLETRSTRVRRKERDRWVPRNLNARLAAEGYLVDAGSEEMGPDTKTALREFQIRHGLSPTGQPDRSTLRAMQTPADRKVKAIVQAMKVIRGAISPGSSSFLHVQVPHAFLEVYLDGVFVRRFSTVVGSATKSRPPGARKKDFQYRTLPLNSAMDRIVVNPEWVVPDSIAEKEILPFVLEDPTWLEKHGYRVVTWSGGKEVFIQTPGSGNALGKVKFLFFNDLGYYLHDTPAKKLFRRPVRLFSHGCIRVEHAMELAGILLGRDQGIQQSTMNLWLKKREQTVIRLKSPIPIHVTYHTAGADSDGQVFFLPDYYELE
jgi:murein L,D-transpeptidase YcbB/YkuD